MAGTARPATRPGVTLIEFGASRAIEKAEAVVLEDQRDVVLTGVLGDIDIGHRCAVEVRLANVGEILGELVAIEREEALASAEVAELQEEVRAGSGGAQPLEPRRLPIVEGEEDLALGAREPRSAPEQVELLGREDRQAIALWEGAVAVAPVR